MIVVHLAGMRDHRYLVRLGDRVDLLRGGDATDPVGVILQDRDGLFLEKLSTPCSLNFVARSLGSTPVRSLFPALPP